MNMRLLRRGECPTLAAPMQTGDGLLARMHPVAGGVTPRQLAGLAKAAARRGNGLVEVTQRGSLQIRGLTAESALLLAAEVDALGISVRSGVPVDIGPLAGLDPDEIADPRPLSEAVRQGIETAGLEQRLGPKVSVLIDGGGMSMLDDVTADVRATAAAPDQWRISVAGNASTPRAIALCSETDATRLVLDLLGEIARFGRTGRARDLERPQSMFRQSPTLPISPGVGEMSGRTKGGGIKHLGGGRFAVLVSLPFGQIELTALLEFVTAAAAAGAAEIRFAPKRSLILLCPSEVSATGVLNAARLADLIIDPADPRASIAACAGAPACASGHLPARAMAASIAASLSKPFDLHVSGCEKRCAKPHHDGLTLVGETAGVALVLEGSDVLARVAKEHAEAAIKRVAAVISAERKADESEVTCIRRIGARRLASAFAMETL